MHEGVLNVFESSVVAAYGKEQGTKLRAGGRTLPCPHHPCYSYDRTSVTMTTKEGEVRELGMQCRHLEVKVVCVCNYDIITAAYLEHALHF